MIALLAFVAAAQAMAMPAALPAAVTAPPVALGPRVWIGYDDRLNFAFGDALARALAQTAIGDARPAARRIVAPRQPEGGFAYAVDLLRRANGRERVAATYRGRCTAATLDTCAGDIAARMARRTGN